MKKLLTDSDEKTLLNMFSDIMSGSKPISEQMPEGWDVSANLSARTFRVNRNGASVLTCSRQTEQGSRSGNAIIEVKYFIEGGKAEHLSTMVQGLETAVGKHKAILAEAEDKRTKELDAMFSELG